MSKDPIDLARHREKREREKLGRDANQAPNPDLASNKFLQWFRRSADHSRDIVPALGHGEVPCVRCKAPLAGHAKRCLNCGLHFSGTAEEFVQEQRHSPAVKLVIIALLLALLFSALVPLWA